MFACQSFSDKAASTGGHMPRHGCFSGSRSRSRRRSRCRSRSRRSSSSRQPIQLAESVVAGDGIRVAVDTADVLVMRLCLDSIIIIPIPASCVLELVERTAKGKDMPRPFGDASSTVDATAYCSSVAAAASAPASASAASFHHHLCLSFDFFTIRPQPAYF
jgi:hypothetical protein